VIECANCRRGLRREEDRCPACGSSDREISITDTFSATDEYWSVAEIGPKTASPRTAKMRPGYTRKRGWEPASDGTFSWLRERLVDRDGDMYREDGISADGRRFFTEERLSDHRNHGSAKRRSLTR
jgi:hypothetical protein